jgi:hypothetical protein
VIGDSLAVGVAHFQPSCEMVARVGISSRDYIDHLLGFVSPVAQQAVISLGVNDSPSRTTLMNLRVVRARIHARRVYWLLPGIKDDVRRMIYSVAAQHHDVLIDTRPISRSQPDHLHPTREGYYQIAKAISAYNRMSPLTAYRVH